MLFISAVHVVHVVELWLAFNLKFSKPNIASERICNDDNDNERCIVVSPQQSDTFDVVTSIQRFLRRHYYWRYLLRSGITPTICMHPHSNTEGRFSFVFIDIVCHRMCNVWCAMTTSNRSKHCAHRPNRCCTRPHRSHSHRPTMWFT